jgi:hypothetical protein
MIELAFILLSKVGTPVGGFGALIVTFLVVYWVYKKEQPSSTHNRIYIETKQEPAKAPQTEELMQEAPNSMTNSNRQVVIKNMQGEVIARLGEEQGCTDDLSTAFLNELDLSNADLEGANLSDAYIGFCNLTGANLRNADLSNAEIECCEVKDADFSGADFSNAQIDITTDIWLDAITDSETLFPSHHRPSYL